MRRVGVHHLLAYCHNHACGHQASIDVSDYPAARQFVGSGHVTTRDRFRDRSGYRTRASDAEYYKNRCIANSQHPGGIISGSRGADW
jgi:hypothetical protein